MAPPEKSATTTTAPPLHRRRHQPFLTILLLILILICFVSAVDGQSDGGGSSATSPPPPAAFNPKFNPSMAIIIVILITSFFFMGFFSIYLRQCGSRDSDASTAGRVAAARSRRAAMRGVEPAVLEKFPLLVYSDVKELKIGKGALECSVCLSEFEDDEMLRLLPKCSHAFHPDCIGMWLASHTTCPVCRANLAAAPLDPDPAGPAAAETVPIPPSETAGQTASSDAEQRAEDDLPGNEQVAIAVEEEPRVVAPEEVVGRSGSSKKLRAFLPWRSGSARPAIGGRVGQYWAEEERERFTLRLPEHVRREVLAGKLSRSASVAAFPAGEGSSRRGGWYRMGEGSSRGGRSFKREWAAKSDRWVAFLSRPLSFKIARGGGDGEGSTRRGGGEGSKSGKASGGKFDCLGGGTAAAATREKEEEEGEAAAMVALANKV